MCSAVMAPNCAILQRVLLELFTCVLLIDLSVSQYGSLRMQNNSITVTEGETFYVCVYGSGILVVSGRIEVEMNSTGDLSLPSSTVLSAINNNCNAIAYYGSYCYGTKCLNVTATDDNIFEDLETFTLSLSTSQAFVTIYSANTTVNIIDDDVVTIEVSNVSGIQIKEGTTRMVCAILSGHLQRDIIVELITTTKEGFKGADLVYFLTNIASNVDYQHTSMTKTFSAGNLEQCLQVTTLRDDVYEYWEIFNVTLTLESPLTDRIMITRNVTNVVITDSTNAVVSMRDTTIVRDESGGDIEVCTQLDGPTGGIERDVTVRLTFGQQGYTDLIFPSSSGVGAIQCKTITVVDDHVFEENPIISDTFILSSTQRRVVASGTTTVTVNDNDDATISLQQPSSLTVDESDSPIRVCAVLNGPTGGLQTTISIQFDITGKNAVTSSFTSLSAMGDTQCTDIVIDNNVYEMSPRQLTISLSTTQTRVTTSGGPFTFNINDDDGATVFFQRNVINDQKFQTALVLSETITLSSSQSRVTVTQQDTTIVIVTDNDDVVVGLTNSSQITRSEGDADVTVCAVINSPAGGLATGQTVTVEFSVTGHVQETVTRTFPSGLPRGATQCTTVSIADENEIFESSPRESHIVTLGSTQSRVTASGTTTITVNDDDDPVIALQQTSYTFPESTPEAVASICVVLEGPTGGLAVPFGVTLSIESGTATADVDFIASMYQVGMMFTTSDVMGSTKCVTIRIVDDDLGEADEVFTVNVQITSQTSRVSIRGGTTATIVIVDNEVFPAPLNLMASNINSRHVQLSWDRPDTTSINVALTGYTVVCSSHAIASISANTTNRVIDNLKPYTTYVCTVDANFVGNNIGRSTPVTVTTLEEAPGSAPLGINKTLSTSSSITLSWSPPLESYGIIIHYTLYIDYNNGATFNTTSTENMFTISSLNPYQTVSVSISASTSVGEGPQSTPVDFTTDQAISSLVVNLMWTVVNESTSDIFWTPPRNLNGVLSNYVVAVCCWENDERNFPTIYTHYRIADLAPFTPYILAVAAVNGAGTGPSEELTFFTAQGTPLTSPMELAVSSLSSTTATITWKHLSLSEARGFITQYTVTYWQVTAGKSSALTQIVSGNENSTIINGLEVDTRYAVTVSASTSEGEGVDSNHFTFTTAGAEVTVAVVGGAVGGTVVNVLIISFCFGLVVLYLKRKKSKAVVPQQNPDVTAREYEEIQLHSQHPQVVSTQKCEAYGFSYNSAVPPPIATSVATEDHVYEMVS